MLQIFSQAAAASEEWCEEDQKIEKLKGDREKTSVEYKAVRAERKWNASKDDDAWWLCNLLMMEKEMDWNEGQGEKEKAMTV